MSAAEPSFRTFLVCLLLLTCTLLPGSGVAQEAEPRRVALVVGNSDYRIGMLRPGAHDAAAIGAALEDLGFETTIAINLDKGKLEQHILDYLDQLTPETVGLFYYSGYMAQSREHNYLIPVDAHLLTAPDIALQSIPLNRLFTRSNELQSHRRQIIILDASRDNPYELNFRQAMGMALPKVPHQTYIVLSNTPAKIYTSDASDKSGPFSRVLLNQLEQTPTVRLNDFFGKCVSGSEKTPMPN